MQDHTVYVTTGDLFEAAREINPECPIEWQAKDGAKIILVAAWGGECPHDSYRSVCVECNTD